MEENSIETTKELILNKTTMNFVGLEIRNKLNKGMKPPEITNLVNKMLADLLKHKELQDLREGKAPEKSCVNNTFKLDLPRYILWVCLELMVGLNKTYSPPILTKSVLDAYTLVDSRPSEEIEQTEALKYYKLITTEHLQDYFTTFKITTKVSKEELIKYGKYLESQKRFGCCANIIVDFDLHSSFDIRSLLIILISKGQFAKCKRIVRSRKVLQNLLVNLMCSNEHCKMAARFLKEFGLPVFEFPHLILLLQKKTVRYYIKMMTRKREEMSLAQVVDLIEDYKSMQILLVEDLILQKLYDLAFVITEVFNLWKLIHPGGAKILSDNVSNKTKIMKKFELELKDPFAPLTSGSMLMPCKFEEVVFVDDMAASFSLIKPLLKARIIGLDFEWRPSMITFLSSRPSILQVASEKCFAVFDIIKLEGSKEFSDFIKEIFKSDSIKIGQSLSYDMKLVCSCYSKMDCYQNILNYVDLAEMFKILNPVSKQCSLAAIVESTLKVPLCKKKQMSNWNRRPLHKAQLHYAILDSYSSVKAFQQMLSGKTEEEQKKLLEKLLTTINIIPDNTIQEGKEEAIIPNITVEELFSPDLIAKAQSVLDVSVKEQ